MRTANIHRVLRPPRVRTVYTVCSALELALSRFENEAVYCVLCSREYTALLGSHALRTKNIYRVLRFE